jgi:hypothetical protein
MISEKLLKVSFSLLSSNEQRERERERERIGLRLPVKKNQFNLNCVSCILW